MMTPKKRRPGRPALPASQKAQPIQIRLHPQVLKLLRRQARRRGIGYQTHINNLLAAAVEVR